MASSEQSCNGYLNEEELLYLNQNEIYFSQAEIFRRNNDYGLQQLGGLKFILWSELTFEFNPELQSQASTIVGLTTSGEIYHLIKFNDRTIARKLSGTSIFKTFSLTNKGRLLAIDENNNNFLFSADLWLESPKKSILKRWLKLWGTVSVGAIGAKFILLNDYYLPIEIFNRTVNLPALEVFFSSVVALSSGFAMLSRYEHLNTHPNGFIKISNSYSLDSWFLDIPLNSKKELNHFAPPLIENINPKLSEEHTIDII